MTGKREIRNLSLSLSLLIFAAFNSACANRRNAPGFYEDYAGKRKDVAEQFERIITGNRSAGIAAVDRLTEMLEAGENEALAVRHFAFRPRRGMARVIIAVEKFPDGIEILRKAIPPMLSLLKTDRHVKVDTILRAVQGSSPRQNTPEAWTGWWNRTGKKIFGVTEQN
jgi:hypothetical protein